MGPTSGPAAIPPQAAGSGPPPGEGGSNPALPTTVEVINLRFPNPKCVDGWKVCEN